MPTIQQQINQLKKDKETLNTMLNTMGVETTGNETFTQLTPLVGKIVSDPILQDKSITIIENGTTNITADEGYDGLYNVSVNTNVASSGGEINVFLQEDEPEKKDGIWVKSENIDNIVIKNTDLTEKWDYDIGTIPIANAYNRVVEYENYLYIFGGRNSSGNAINNAYKYNLKTNQCFSITSLPVSLIASGIGIVGTDVYIFGGHSGSTYYANAYKYDILNDTYTEIKSLPQGNSQMGYLTIGTDIYIFGGQNANKDTLNTVYKYNTITDTYTQLSNMPITNRTISPVVVGTDIYIFGGLEYNGYTSNCYKYNILTDKYTQLASLPEQIGHLSCAYINGFIYVFSGYNNTGGITSFYKYDIEANNFTKLTNMSKSIYNPGYICIGNKMYLVGGQRVGGYLDTISSYGFNEVYKEDTVVISTNDNSYETKLLDKLSVAFNDVYIYKAEKKEYITSPTYYGDGTKWTKFKN